MRRANWLSNPLRSSDPALNAAILVLLLMVLVLAFIIGLTVVTPIVIALILFKAFQWYMRRPVPTDRLYRDTQQRVVAANFPAVESFIDSHIDRFLEALASDLPAYGIFGSMVLTTEALYKKENLNNPLPPLTVSSEIEEGRYRDDLVAQQRKSVDAPRTLKVFNGTVSKAYLDFIRLLPAVAKTTPEEFSRRDDIQPFATFPLVDVLPDGPQAVSAVMFPFLTDEVAQIGLFSSVRRQVERNFRDAVPLEKHKGTTREIVTDYLHHTELEELFYAPVPFAITDQQRYEHTHVVGGSGHGKTQLLQRLIVHDLDKPEPPALVIIDSQGEMLNKIQRLQLFADQGRLADKLICIDPEDIDYSPALNMFAMPSRRIEGYSKSVKEQVEAGTIELFNYIFGAIAAELTSRQNTTFAYVTRLMLNIPGATIHTLRELFEDSANSIDASPFAPYIRALDGTSQGFFENQFFTKAYSQTKSQIARRLYGVLQVASFDRMFSAQDNKLDMFAAMQSGNIVLINTSKALLKTEASALFGRYMIARVIAAAFERIALPASQRNPAFLMVDEAAEYFDENLETLLSQARKFNVGVLFAHQHLDQLTPGLRSSVAANTSIKFAGGVSDKDARALAGDMRTSPDFITGMTKRGKSTEFACYVRNYTGNAVRLTIPFGTLESEPRMTTDEHARLIARNRERYAIDPGQPRPVAAGADLSPSAGAAAQNVVPTTPSNVPDDWRS